MAETTSAPATKTKALCVATRCTTVDQFIETFRRFCDETSFFVATLTSRPVGLETPFAIQLADRTPVLRGICTVLDAWATSANKFKRPGIRLGIQRLTPDSAATYARLREAALGAAPAPPDDGPTVNDDPMAMHTAVTKEGPSAAELRREAAIVGRAAARPLTDAEAWMADRTPAPDAPPRVVIEPGRRAARSKLAPPVVPDTPAKSTPSAAPALPIPREPTSALPLVIRPPAPPAPIPRDRRVFAKPITPLGVTVVAVQPVELAAVAVPIVTGEIPAAGADGRIPGSELVLPANPLMNLTDESIGGFVDCTLYEETANFVSDDASGELLDPIVPPPSRPRPDSLANTRPRTIPPAIVAAAGPPLSTDAPVAFVAVDALGRPTTIPPWMAIPPPIAPRAAAAPPSPQPSAEVGAPVESGPVARRRRPRWLLVAVPTTVAAITGIVVLAGVLDDAPAAPARPATPVASVASPTIDAPAPTDAAIPATPPTAHTAHPVRDPSDERDEPAETDATGGLPVVGEGPCLVNITTTPAGSNVVVDGRAIGPSPLTFAGPCQRRKIDVVHPRYKPATQWVTLARDKPSAVDIRLTRPTHAIAITTFPIGATISIGGRRAGTSPTTVQVMGYSNLTIKVEKAGWKPVTTKVYSKELKDKLFVRLAR